MTPTRTRLEAAALLRLAERLPAANVTPDVRAVVELAVRTALDVAAEALAGKSTPHAPAEDEVDPTKYAARRTSRPTVVPSPDGVPLLIDQASWRRDPC